MTSGPTRGAITTSWALQELPGGRGARVVEAPSGPPAPWPAPAPPMHIGGVPVGCDPEDECPPAPTSPGPIGGAPSRDCPPPPPGPATRAACPPANSPPAPGRDRAVGGGHLRGVQPPPAGPEVAAPTVEEAPPARKHLGDDLHCPGDGRGLGRPRPRGPAGPPPGWRSTISRGESPVDWPSAPGVPPVRSDVVRSLHPGGRGGRKQGDRTGGTPPVARDGAPLSLPHQPPRESYPAPDALPPTGPIMSKRPV